MVAMSLARVLCGILIGCLGASVAHRHPLMALRGGAQERRPKFVVVTGGVISGIGKGITASSVGVLMKMMGLRPTAVKIDPYVNCDAGTMSPFEHGEVFVLHDGGECDLDLGNYERFLNVQLRNVSNLTTGKIYQSVINAERRGDYLGKTVQVVPHVTDEIIRCIMNVAMTPVDNQSEPPDVCIIELGGTLGDIESMPFVEALRQLQLREGWKNVAFLHVSLVPTVGSGPTSEQKSKPTQHGVKAMRSLGLSPDFLMCRSRDPLNDSTRRKLSLFCDVPEKQVVSVHDVSNLYRVPILLARQGVARILAERLKLVEPEFLKEHVSGADPLEDPLLRRGQGVLDFWQYFGDRVDEIKSKQHDAKGKQLEGGGPVPLRRRREERRKRRRNARGTGTKVQIGGKDVHDFWQYLADRVDATRSKNPDAKDKPPEEGGPIPMGTNVRIAMVAKYAAGMDTYHSVTKALEHASIKLGVNLEIVWVQAEALEISFDATEEEQKSQDENWQLLRGAHGILVPGGFGYRGWEGKIKACRYARLQKVPFLGICLGFQAAVTDFMRDPNGLNNALAQSEEFADQGGTTGGIHPEDRSVIYMPEINPGQMGGTMRLGGRQTLLEEGSLARKLYDGAGTIVERHRHRYEVNPKIIRKLKGAGLRFSGVDSTGSRMEILEMDDHPYFIGTQFHPEFKSRPNEPAPAFLSFVEAAARSIFIGKPDASSAGRIE